MKRDSARETLSYVCAREKETAAIQKMIFSHGRKLSPACERKRNRRDKVRKKEEEKQEREEREGWKRYVGRRREKGS